VPRPPSELDRAKAGLRAIGERPIGTVELDGYPVALAFTRRVGPSDQRRYHYVTFDGRIWIGANFASRQNPGPGVRAAILAAGAPIELTLEDLGL